MKRMLACLFVIGGICGSGLSGENQQTPGSFATMRLDGLTLHVFTTTEGPGDISYIFETDDSLVLFELPSVHHLSRQLKAYVDDLSKPVAAILVAYHVGGASYYPGVPIHAH